MTLWPLDQLFAQRPGRTPVAFSKGALQPLGQLRRDVSACAARLRQIGGRRALLVTRDAYWGAVGLLALASSGKEIILPPNALAQTLGAIAEHDDIVLGDDALEAEPRAIRLCAGDALTKDSVPEIDPATPVIFFTSGSTGEPKRIEKTLLQLEDEARSIETLAGHTLGPEALVLGTVIHQHAYGLAFRLIWPLLSGRIIYGPMVSLWEDVLAAMPSGAALVTGPAHLSRVAGLEPVSPAQRPALILSAGGPLGESAAREARAFLTMSITEIFGSTETGAIAWRPRDGQDAPWAPLPDVTITRTGDGLLHALAPHIAAEPGRPGQTLSDQIEMAAGGTFRLNGRRDRIAKIEGARISLDELEKALIALPEIEHAAVIVLPGETALLAAAVVPSGTGAQHLSAVGAFQFGLYLRSALAHRLPPAARPKRWRFVEVLPVNAMGKRTMHEMIQLFQPQASAPLHTGAPKVDPQIIALRRFYGGCEIDCVVPPDLSCFKGHFPAMPILPGVVQIDWVVRLANRYLSLGTEAASAFQVKFRRIIGRNQLFTLRLRVLPARRLAFEYLIDGETASSGSVALPSIASKRPAHDPRATGTNGTLAHAER
jgi:acyl-coenzyme A synthetase/AMP-(fatty) acid ligase